MEIKRGYVKWTDENGVFHKEPLVDHPEMLAKASPAEQLAAEEVRRLNASAEEYMESVDDHRDQDARDTLAALRKAPEEVLTAGQLTTEAPDSGAEEDGEKTSEVESLQKPAAHDEELARFREETAD